MKLSNNWPGLVSQRSRLGLCLMAFLTLIAFPLRAHAADANASESGTSGGNLKPASEEPAHDGVAPNDDDKSAPVVPASSATFSMQAISGTAQGERYPDWVLRVVTPDERSFDLGLMVIGALLGSFRTPVPKEGYRGTKINAVRHPISGSLLTGLRKSIDDWHRRMALTKTYKNPILVRPDTFSLVYTEYGVEKPTYDLSIGTSVSRKPDSAGWFLAGAYVFCRDTYSSPSLTLEQWEADDYAAVKARSEEHAAACIAKVEAEYEKLFAD